MAQLAATNFDHFMGISFLGIAGCFPTTDRAMVEQRSLEALTLVTIAPANPSTNGRR
jgi:hypothetical protein